MKGEGKRERSDIGINRKEINTSNDPVNEDRARANFP